MSFEGRTRSTCARPVQNNDRNVKMILSLKYRHLWSVHQVIFCFWWRQSRYIGADDWYHFFSAYIFNVNSGLNLTHCVHPRRHARIHTKDLYFCTYHSPSLGDLELCGFWCWPRILIVTIEKVTRIAASYRKWIYNSCPGAPFTDIV